MVRMARGVYGSGRCGGVWGPLEAVRRAGGRRTVPAGRGEWLIREPARHSATPNVAAL